MSGKTKSAGESTGDRRPEATERKPFRFVPKTTVGKTLLATYLVAFVAVALSVTGVVFADPELVGPMAAPALWAYAWFGVMNVVLIGTYVYLFGPWARSAERFVDGETEWDDLEDRRQSPGTTVIEERDN